MYIAHIRGSESIQTVKEHAEGTAERTVRYARCAGTESVAALQGLLHDYGKLCSDFTEYIMGSTRFRRGDIDHSYAGARFVLEAAAGMERECVDAARFIAHTIVSHHGIHDWFDENGSDYLKKRTSEARNYPEILAGAEEILSREETQKRLLNAGAEYRNIRGTISSLCKGDKHKKKSRTFYMGMFERLMQSILMDADRTDTADFMTGQCTELIYDRDDYQQIWQEMQQRLEEKLAEFEHRTDRISLQRKSILERCKAYAQNDVRICRLIVPTGGGKTLSSLRFALEQARLYGKEKLVYVAPFMSILEQNSDEILSVSSAQYFTEHHSNALNEIDDAEELRDYELRTEKWDTPVLATTLVQFFNALFSSRTSAVRRMHRLCNAVIIIDEVQSIPAKCVHLFNLAMNFLAYICGSTIVLCSATQPCFENTEFPLRMDENASMTGDYSEDFRLFQRTELLPRLTKYGMTYAETAAFCRDAFEKAGNLLVIVNTKAAARQLYERMQVLDYSITPEIIHLSTNMCPQHRRAAISHMRESLDKPIICVTTQLIEAGVDISFKCVVRSLAGLDSINQAAGRCNRHGENPEHCPVYIVEIKEENTARLKEIQRAKDLSRRIVSDAACTDYAAVDTLSLYYAKLFETAKEELSYPIRNPDTTLLRLLSTNSDWYNVDLDPVDFCGGVYEGHTQAFRTAGEHFALIDHNTIDILIPYDESAEELIALLDSELNMEALPELLRRAQKYMVSIYCQMQHRLTENGAIYPLRCGALALKKEHYDPALGVVTEGSQMELLCL